MKISDDSQLVSAYIQGNENALAELIHRHKNKVFGYIFSKVLDKEIAEDIFQDTFIKVILTLKERRYNEEGKFLPWVMRIAHNLAIDYFRAKRKTQIISEVSKNDDFSLFDFLADTEDSTETKLIKFQIENDLHHMIDQLPDDQQEVLRLRIFKELSFKEIAEETNVSINTALGRMRYALINLRKVMEDNNISLTLV